MTLEQVGDCLHLREIDEPLFRGWAGSERTFPTGPPPFLVESFVRENGALASLPAERIEGLLEVARRARADSALCLLLWHEHRLYTGVAASEPPVALPRRRAKSLQAPIQGSDPSGFPDLSPAVGDDAPAMNLLVALSAVPNTRWLYQRRRIPEAVLRDTLSDFALRFRAGGIDIRTLTWLQNHLQGRLFRLGRLQFRHGSFPRELTVYRSGSRVRVLAAAGLAVDARGLLLFGPGDVAGWLTIRRRESGALFGNPILPTGVVERRELRLDLVEYQPVLWEKEPVLEIHVPAGEPLLAEACADSVTRAMTFFPAYFPERGFRALTCESWMLGRELLDLLSPASNIFRFASELYLYPSMGGEQEALERIFGPSVSTVPPSRRPRSTSLQRRAADHLASGGGFRLGGGFLLTEDLPWGRRVYRSPPCLSDSPFEPSAARNSSLRPPAIDQDAQSPGGEV